MYRARLASRCVGPYDWSCSPAERKRLFSEKGPAERAHRLRSRPVATSGFSGAPRLGTPGRSRLAVRGALVVALFLGVSPTLAAPHARFDTALTAACRDVTTPIFAADHPDEMLIELPLRVSVLFFDAEDAQIEQLLFVARGQPGRLRVIDYYPSTETMSAVYGPVEVVETNDAQDSNEASLGGGVSLDYGPADVSIKPSAKKGTSTKNTLTETYKRRAPRDLLTASGTTNAGHGVFYKLRASKYTTLEGDHPLVIRAAVPKTWRGDWITVECRADAAPRRSDRSEKAERTVGRYRVLVGLYLMGAAEAQEAAEELSGAQRDLAAAAAARPKEKPKPTGLRAISVALSRVDEALSVDRLIRQCKPHVRRDQKVTANAPAEPTAADQKEQGRAADPAERLRLAKESLQRLAGQ